MTTLFNLFCPFFLKSMLEFSILVFVLVTGACVFILKMGLEMNFNSFISNSISKSLFPLGEVSSIYFSGIFFTLALFNLISLVSFSFPVTTVLAFNFSTAFSLWFMTILLLLNKSSPFASFLPSNSPWYLIPFLGIVELVSILVRPITLCFRLLANMSAGHILLSLICKMSNNLWLLGVLFGLLELMVAVVQSFVFLMLIMVYLEEGLSH